jgi:succinate dehydrogenase hydrophobic anchor subunit
MADPIWKAIDIAFLFFVLMHAITGTYVAVTDLERLGVYRRVLIGLSIVVGIVAFIYGAQTIIAFQPPA